MRTERPFWALSVLAICLIAVPAAGLSLDHSPRPAILLRKSDRFIVISAWNSVGLYSLKDGELLREFPVGEYLRGPGQVDPGERFLVNVNDKAISLWEIDSGKKLWSKRPFPEERLFRPSFSADGSRLLIRGRKKFLVYEARQKNAARIGLLKLDKGMITNFGD